MARHRTDRRWLPGAATGVVAAALALSTTGVRTAGALFTAAPAAPSTTTSSATLGAPTSLHCTSITSSAVDLAWTAPAGVSQPALLRYSIQRRLSGTGSYTTLNATPQAATTYHDVPGAIGVYDYVVSSSYQSWTSVNTAPDSVTFALVGSLCSA